MWLKSKGGNLLQKGRGIGGLLRAASSLFKPFFKTVGSTALKVARSNTGKAIGKALKEQAISSAKNIAIDTILYIYKIWQTKFDEMKSVVDGFIEDNENVVQQIKQLALGQKIFLIFDDLINSKSLMDIATLFTVDGRHMNMSMAFLTQRMFVNNEHFRQISQNCDYFFVYFKTGEIPQRLEL